MPKKIDLSMNRYDLVDGELVKLPGNITPIKATLGKREGNERDAYFLSFTSRVLKAKDSAELSNLQAEFTAHPLGGGWVK